MGTLLFISPNFFSSHLHPPSPNLLINQSLLSDYAPGSRHPSHTIPHRVKYPCTTSYFDYCSAFASDACSIFASPCLPENAALVYSLIPFPDDVTNTSAVEFIVSIAERGSTSPHRSHDLITPFEYISRGLDLGV